jgi:hypothetical protein
MITNTKHVKRDGSEEKYVIKAKGIQIKGGE